MINLDERSKKNRVFTSKPQITKNNKLVGFLVGNFKSWKKMCQWTLSDKSIHDYRENKFSLIKHSRPNNWRRWSRGGDSYSISRIGTIADVFFMYIPTTIESDIIMSIAKVFIWFKLGILQSPFHFNELLIQIFIVCLQNGYFRGQNLQFLLSLLIIKLKDLELLSEAFSI